MIIPAIRMPRAIIGKDFFILKKEPIIENGTEVNMFVLRMKFGVHVMMERTERDSG